MAPEGMSASADSSWECADMIVAQYLTTSAALVVALTWAQFALP